ncbi:MAG: ribonuclease III [Calditrichaeota bacterium]|nr:MAG: ribonuclease III [Calditrichota bacterium]
MDIFKKISSKLFPERSETSSEILRASAAELNDEEARVVETFQQKFHIHFHDPRLLATALKHRSYLNLTNEPRTQSNERLEFLGDAVLDLVVTHYLYEKFPNKTEGYLSKVKSILVSKPVMGDIAAELSLGQLMLMNRGEEKTGGRKRQSILADAFEAIIGAIYLDNGYDSAKKFINDYLLKDIKKILRKGLYKNYKSILLEYAQGTTRGVPVYRIIEESGPDHAKEFVIGVWIGNEKLGEGKGRSKKIAEQEAAKQAIQKLGISED